MSELPTISCRLQDAAVHTQGDRLVLTTGAVRRVWKMTPSGLSTCEVRHEQSGRVWKGDAGLCDWQFPDVAEPSDAALVSLSAEIGDDEGFTSEHIRTTAEFDYPEAKWRIRLEIWAYPGVPGIRTHLAVRDLPEADHGGQNLQGTPPEGRVDRLPVGDTPYRRRLIGYYGGTQQRNDTHLDLIKEEVIAHPLNGREWCDWASALCVEDDSGGLALVKESHKCVNQQGHATGGFVCDGEGGLACTGWGLRAEEVSDSEFTRGWATWSLAWAGGDLERQCAFRAFDRARYPIDPQRDIYIQANTWGSSDNSRDARRAATEASVLQELEICADLGIDSLQIDDGWQVPPGHHTWQPGENGWHPHPEGYPEGWGPVRARAEELGIRLGLWAAAEPIGLEELKSNREEGGFVQHKLDFAYLKSRAQIDALMHKVRQFIQSTGHRVRVNWDLTENAPRYGYFFAREYGCVYLENRKPHRPLSVVYRPHTVLRDLWQVSRYLNLHRFQCSVQDVDRVDRERSDAHLHSHSYAVAAALMGIPLFFLETKYYSDAARAEIRPLLAVYKRHRDAIYRGMVHPIGHSPDNASWTGFQCHLPEQREGYLTIFRERCNDEPSQSLALAWLPPGQIEVEDLLQGTSARQDIGAGGRVTFHIPDAPGFLFLRYRPT